MFVSRGVSMDSWNKFFYLIFVLNFARILKLLKSREFFKYIVFIMVDFLEYKYAPTYFEYYLILNEYLEEICGRVISFAETFSSQLYKVFLIFYKV